MGCSEGTPRSASHTIVGMLGLLRVDGIAKVQRKEKIQPVESGKYVSYVGQRELEDDMSPHPTKRGSSLVQWCAFTAKDVGSIPGQEIKKKKEEDGMLRGKNVVLKS